MITNKHPYCEKEEPLTELEELLYPQSERDRDNPFRGLEGLYKELYANNGTADVIFMSPSEFEKLQKATKDE